MIRELLNVIAHEYEEEALISIHREALRLTLLLLAVPAKTEEYLQRGP